MMTERHHRDQKTDVMDAVYLDFVNRVQNNPETRTV